MKQKAHVIVSGRVQGVWFRASTKQQAEKLKLTGWVRNIEGNKVEAVFEGDKENINEMIAWCHTGPSLAEVTDLQVTYEPYSGVFPDFSIKY